MAEIKTVGDSQGWFYVLTDFSTLDISALKLADLTGTGALEGTWDAAASGTRFSFTNSDTVADPSYGDESNSQAVGRSNYEGSIAPFLLKDSGTGEFAATPLYTAVATKGARILVVSGVTGGPNDERAAGDLYDAFEFITDNAQKPTEVGGYMKRNIPLLPAGKSVAGAALVTGP